MKKYRNILLFIFLLGFLFSNERILNYNVVLELNNDGSLFIIENIVVKAEGNKIQRGIMREFPTKYKDQYGNNINIKLNYCHTDCHILLKDNVHYASYSYLDWGIHSVQ